MSHKAVVLDEQSMVRAINRIAYEIIEKNHGVDNVVIVGIQRRGVPIAKRIATKINSVENSNVPVGILDITLYRDDLSTLSTHPIIKGTDIQFTMQGVTQAAEYQTVNLGVRIRFPSS